MKALQLLIKYIFKFNTSVLKNNHGYYIDKTSIVKTDKVGERTRIWQYVVILDDVEIGEDCNICSHCFIENGVRIGNRVTIKNGVQIWQGIKIEDDVFIGPNATFTNDLYPRSRNYDFKPAQTIIKRGASIGANSTIVAGVTIGEWSMIGAGSVVTRDVPPFGLVYGNPAKLMGWVCVCGKKLHVKDEIVICDYCKRSYVYSKADSKLLINRDVVLKDENKSKG